MTMTKEEAREWLIERLEIKTAIKHGLIWGKDIEALYTIDTEGRWNWRW